MSRCRRLRTKLVSSLLHVSTDQYDPAHCHSLILIRCRCWRKKRRRKMEIEMEEGRTAVVGYGDR